MKEQDRILVIDSFRGGSAIIIACVYHLATIPLTYPTGLPFHTVRIVNWVYRHGGIFVALFLLISGYTAFLSYTGKIDNGMTLGQFAVRRTVRIFPLMLGTLVLSAIGSLAWFLVHGHSWWIGNMGNNTLVTFILNCLGLQMFYPGPQSWNYPAWSLSVFFVCWFIFWLVIRFTRDRKNLRAPICAAIILLGIGLIQNPLPTEVAFLNSSVAEGYIAFFSGGLLYYVLNVTEDKKRESAIAAGLILAVLFVLHILGVPTGSHTIVFGAVLFPCLLFLALRVKVLNRLFSLPPLVYLGRISFSIYLCNYPIEIFMVLLDERLNLRINYSSPVFFFAFMFVHVLAASVFWKVFEDMIPKQLKQKYLPNNNG